MENLSDLLPLENYLLENSSKKVKFPNRSDQYFNKYKCIKDWLRNNVYKHIGAATSAEDGGIYTDHGIDHFNAVIDYAGKLIELDNKTNNCIDPYEVFLLLTSILLHDAGNVYGRLNHEKEAFSILNTIKEFLTDSFECKIIADLAEVHGGKTDTGDKDTIGNKRWKDKHSFGGISYRPNLIAALVRFADEICEDCNRCAKHLIETNKLPKPSEVFHHYANSIKSVEVDRLDKSIRLEIFIDEQNVHKKLGKLSEEVYLIDEIMSRLEKMNNERIYCTRFMCDVIQLRQIKASIFIVDKSYSTLKNEEFKLEDKGYPSYAKLLAKEHPGWVGEKLKESFKYLEETPQINAISDSTSNKKQKRTAYIIQNIFNALKKLT